MDRKNIVLIGMMGSGKSTIGHLLDAKLHDFQYLDIDKEIEKLAQKHIHEIFALHGESHFRKLEHEMIAKYSNYHNQVISTGGGVVENSKNIELLKKNGIIFYLKASADELFSRVNKSHLSDRPMLNQPNPKQRLQDLIKKREPFYQTADYEIDTENKDLEDIVNEIMEKYEQSI